MTEYAFEDSERVMDKIIYALFGIASFGGYWIGRFLGASREEMIGVGVAFVLAGLAGWFVGRISSHYVDGDGYLAKALALSLLASWAWPIGGFFLSAVVHELRYSAVRWKPLHIWMSCIGFICSLAGSIASVLALHGG